MGQKIFKHWYCDWCGAVVESLPHNSPPFSGTVTHKENGPDNWNSEELCSACDSAFKHLRKTRKEQAS